MSSSTVTAKRPQTLKRRFREGMAQLERSESGLQCRCFDLLTRLKDYSGALEVAAMWEATAAAWWELEIADEVIGAHFDWIADHTAFSTTDVKTQALMAATANIIAAVKDADEDEVFAWRSYANALEWESVLTSKDPDKRAKKLREQEEHDRRNGVIAKLDRPKARSALRAKFVKALRAERLDDATLKVALKNLCAAPRDGLRITCLTGSTEEDRYRVEDENAKASNKKATKKIIWTHSTISGMWAEAGRPRAQKKTPAR